MDRLRNWWRTRDPEGEALRKAVRVAIVAPALLAVIRLFSDNTQLMAFAVFGSVAMLLFTDLPGDRPARFAGYLGLTLAGVVLITVATLLATPWWVAGLGMAVVGFLITFSGVLSAAAAASGRAALLAFILPVTLPGGWDDLAPRLTGWLLAAVVAIPAALFLLPARHHDALRSRIADACRAICTLLRSADDSSRTTADAAALASIQRLRAEFARTDARPVGLSTGSRFLIRVIDDLGWLRAAISAANNTGDSTASDHRQHRPGTPVERERLREGVRAILADAADTIDPARSAALRTEARQRLEQALDDLDALRRLLGGRTLSALVAADDAAVDTADDAADGTADLMDALRIDRTWHTGLHAAALVGATVAVAAEADARSPLAKILGRRPQARPGADPMGILPTARSIAGGQLARHSVALRNALRMGLGLGIAIGAAELLSVDHAFWVGLGAMSVLRSRALATTASAWRALLGTTLGFVVGSLVIVLLGTSPAVLWPVIPVALLVAALAPRAISFTAGQAAFTVMVVALFNLLQPVGWSVGVVRIQDVALGCASGLIAGFLTWPRGAAGALDDAVRDSIRAGADELALALQGHGIDHATDQAVKAANTRADDALRGLLAERPGGVSSIDLLNARVAAGVRLRLVADAVAVLAERAGAEDGGPAYDLVAARTSRIVTAFREVAEEHAPTPRPPADHDAQLLGALRQAPPEQAAATLWIDLYLDDLVRLLGVLGEKLRAVREPRA
ncbi:hypothetical protein GIS00_12645 [Nakamurella sp. YIM 132087]|uniref:Integral membrane bound transporter domain-containing protein n=1 Tax=Nakamurella alba TaxID=2665158 RepID=A0A7K1FN99_9ACTN|nr:FUSC family protein [Nakamurella alba]MTD14789.1 hypothetical protein [Nakamurella alba]